MNIKEALLQEHSKSNTLAIARYIGQDAAKFNTLMDLFFGNDQVLNQRSAWVVSAVFDKYPHLVFPYLKQLIENLNNPVHDAVKRNTLRILQFIAIPATLQGIACDLCFKLLQSHESAIAIKVFAMTVLKNICKAEPDLKNELKITLEEQLPHASKGFISRAKLTLNELKRIS